MRVFVSSGIKGMEPYREAAADAIRTLEHEPRMAEDYNASSDTPQEACLRGVRDADVTVLLLGARYGALQESGLSATHEEYREARDRRPMLAFVQEGVERESAQDNFVREVQDWTSGQYTASFSTADDLRVAVTRGLHQLEMSRAVGSVDEDEMLTRAKEYVSATYPSKQALSVVVAGGPYQQVLRPAELEAEDLSSTLMKEALFGSSPILDLGRGTSTKLEGNVLVLEQDPASIRIDELGTAVIAQSAVEERNQISRGLSVLIEETIRERIEHGLLFAGWTLDLIDKPKRLSDIVVVAALLGVGYLGWQTRAEHEANPSTVPGRLGGSDRIVVTLSPVRRHRAALKMDAQRMAEDLTVRLRREVRS
jgi:hypothetical protein